jgi:hypothetical protein
MEGYGKTFRQKAYENFANRFTGCAGKASGNSMKKEYWRSGVSITHGDFWK